MAEQQAEPTIGGPGTFPDPASNQADQASPIDPRILPQNPALRFLYDPANANLIAIFGWVSIAACIYYYVYGVPKMMKKSDSRNYQQKESESGAKSRENRLKKLQDELDKQRLIGWRRKKLKRKRKG